MKNSDVDSQPKFQAHLQFAQANAQSKIAKELKTPSHSEKQNNEMLTMAKKHRGFGGKLEVQSFE